MGAGGVLGGGKGGGGIFSPVTDMLFGAPPDAPDYTAAANATAAGNLDAARANSAANRINQYTPYGDLIYSQTPTYGADGKLNPDAGWSQTVNLSPVGKALLDRQNWASLGLGNEAIGALGRVHDTLSDPFDYSSVGDVNDAAYGAFTSRLDPLWAQREGQLDAKLANQGIMPGSEAYNNDYRTFNEGRNDAYQQAILGGIQTMPQTMQLATALRNQPLNELNALRTGSQVTNPAFQNVAQQANTQGPDLLGAASAQYGASADQYNARMGAAQGLMNLGASIYKK